MPEQISEENILIYAITLNGQGNNLTACDFIARGCLVMEIKLIGHHIYRYYLMDTNSLCGLSSELG